MTGERLSHSDRTRSGRGSVSRDHVEDIQRARIMSAMAEVASEGGYIGAAVAPVVARAGVSRRTFYELFDGREDCFAATFDWGVAQARGEIERAGTAKGASRSWRERVRQALAALLGFLDDEPTLARVLVIEALGAGKPVLERRARALGELMETIEREAPATRSTGQTPLLTAEGVVGGAFSVIHGRLLQRDARPLVELHGQLMALIALPYLGPRIAGEELTRSPPDVKPRRGVGDEPVGADGSRLLERLDMRLTYRTVRCLIFIAERPGASNREIVAGAEISDEGQASKLLGRLSRLGLIANSRPPGPGQANQWTLTLQGRHVLSAVQAG